LATGLHGAGQTSWRRKDGATMALLKNRIKLKSSKIQALKIIKQLDGLIDALRKATDEFEQ
jgi:hypothetical protein